MSIVILAFIALNTGVLSSQIKTGAFENNIQSTVLLDRPFADVLRGSSAGLDSRAAQARPLNYQLTNEQQLKKGSIIGLFGAALIGGALGYLGGGLLGYEIESSSCGDSYEDYFCGLGGFLIGASAGGALLMPLGTHVANAGRGNTGATILATLGATAFAWGIAASNGSGEDLVLMVPLFQLTTSIAVERLTDKN